jgi:phage-related protein
MTEGVNNMTAHNKSHNGRRMEEAMGNVKENLRDNVEDVKENVSENVNYAMPAFDDLKKDIGLLQSDVANLASSVRKVGADTAHDAMNYVNGHIDTLKGSGMSTVGKLEGRIRSKPGQSVTIAFVAGLLASQLFKRKS